MTRHLQPHAIAKAKQLIHKPKVGESYLVVQRREFEIFLIHEMNWGGGWPGIKKNSRKKRAKRRS